MKINKQTIGQRIKELRESKQMTQTQLADLLFVSDKTISKWEKDKSEPENAVLIKMANIFNVTLDYLITGNNPLTDATSVSKIELACREDNIALLDGVQIDSFDENGKNIEFYANKYNAKNIKAYLLNYDIARYVEENKTNKRFHIAAIPKDCVNEDDLVLVAWDGPYEKAPKMCAEFEKKGYHHFRVLREIGVNEKASRDYQFFSCHCLDFYGNIKIQINISILDDNQSGILKMLIFKDKTYNLKKRDNSGKLVPDYYPETSNDLEAYAYIRPSAMDDFLNTLSQIDVVSWENKNWGCSIMDLFFVMKEKGSKNLQSHKFYIAPGKDKYKKLVRAIQNVCVESLKPLQYKKFVSVFDVDYTPYCRQTLSLFESMRVFKDIELEQKEMQEDNFDVCARFGEERE